MYRREYEPLLTPSHLLRSAQCMVINHARQLLGWKNAHSTEFVEDAEHKVIIFMPEIDKDTMGGTMRLGARDTLITDMKDGSKVRLGVFW